MIDKYSNFLFVIELLIWHKECIFFLVFHLFIVPPTSQSAPWVFCILRAQWHWLLGFLQLRPGESCHFKVNMGIGVTPTKVYAYVEFSFPIYSYLLIPFRCELQVYYIGFFVYSKINFSTTRVILIPLLSFLNVLLLTSHGDTHMDPGVIIDFLLVFFLVISRIFPSWYFNRFNHCWFYLQVILQD